MTVLSSYRLSDENNQRIAEKVHEEGGRFLPTGFNESSDEIVERIDQHIEEATVFLGGRLTPAQFERAAALRWIHVPWAGVNTLFEVEAIRTSSILISNSSGIMADAVADQVMAYLLMLNRSLPKQLRWQEGREWNRYTSVEHPDRQILRGKVLGILGYGAIGQEIARRASAFGMTIWGLKRSPATGEEEVDRIFSPAEKETFLSGSDFVVITLPLTPETEGSFGKRELEVMPRKACLINVARGKIIRQDELIDAIQSGEIAGGAFDVLQEEPLPPESMLWGLKNVIITPHSSGGFVGFGTRTTTLFLDNLDRFCSGRDLLNRIDPAAGY